MVADPRFLADVHLFASMDDDERAALAAIMEGELFSQGRVIYEEGEPGGTMHVITEGVVEVSLRQEEGEKLVLERLGPGDFFGELSLLDGGTRSATVTAMEPTATLRLGRDALLALLMQRPHMAQDMMVALAHIVRSTDDLLKKRASRNANEVIEERETLGNRVADGVARFGGSWGFIFSFAAILLSWVVLNTVLLGSGAFDVYPFILLNLFLSMLAAIQAPIIMMSQNRQDAKDRIRSELDYQVNLKAEVGVSELLRKVSSLEEAMEEVRTRLAAPGDLRESRPRGTG
jgi:CRP/FNR family transcriptional regulator, cyclic AMP receptor protein